MSQCCDEKKPPVEQSCCCPEPKDPPWQKVSAEWSKSDHTGQIKSRISNKFRMNYKVNPGLYTLGDAGAESPVFVSANYALSFNVLRRELKGIDCWILVLDTKGINVWCAAGKGTFGTQELINRIALVKLETVVAHRSVIVPQLGAPGVSGHEVKKATGFSVKFGPVYAKDIPAYIASGFKATTEMRTVVFPLADRAVLIPMELIPALRKFAWIALSLLAIMGLQPQGILFRIAIINAWPVIVAGLLAVFAGTVVVPSLLPFIPFRSFAAKGVLAGTIILSPMVCFYQQFFNGNLLLTGATGIFFISVASYLALNFTGCTTFTSISGVKKEMRFAVPVYFASCIIAAILLIVFKAQEWGIL